MALSLPRARAGTTVDVDPPGVGRARRRPPQAGSTRQRGPRGGYSIAQLSLCAVPADLMHPYRTTPYTVNGNAAHDRRASLHACAATPRPWGSGRFLMEPWRRRRSRSKKKGVGRASGSVTSTSLSPSLLSGLGQRDAVLGGQAAAAMVATDRCVATRSLSLSPGAPCTYKSHGRELLRLGSAPIIKDGGCVVRGASSRPPHVVRRGDRTRAREYCT
jgi:hypothetical protein